MADLSGIHSVVARARRRLKLQSALETGTFALIPAAAAALVVIFLVRTERLAPDTGLVLLAACAALVLGGALFGYLRRYSTTYVATRVDRASGLADRLASACHFEGAVADPELPPETAALMRAAIDDAVRALPRADAKAATPFSWPRELRPALAFVAVTAIVGGLAMPPPDGAPLLAGAGLIAGAPGEAQQDEERVVMDQDDLDLARELVAELRRTAEQTEDLALETLADELEALLDQAERGEISKKELLEKQAKLEEEYRRGSEEAVEEALSDLKKTGETLAKEPLTRELGKALQKGQLDDAKKQLEKLADKMEQGEISKEQQAKLAKAMEKAASDLKKAADARQKAQDQQISKAQDEVRKLQRQLDQAKSEEQKKELARRLQKKERDLKRLQREKQKRDESDSKRALKRLARNMEKAAEQMQQKQQTQASRREISRTMRDMARGAGKVDADKRKMANQKKIATQMSDLEEALRRAKQKGQKGPNNRFGRNKRDRDFARRARGGQGSRGAWRPGQTGGGKKPGQGQKGQGGQGTQPGGDSYGDGHDPNLLGDPTAKSGNTEDESLQGVRGKGASVRETVLTAAQKGFSSRGYQDVYTRYKTIVEEVIRAEKVPSGYKYYVKKYFQKIKPHAM